jgi:hypothetical protein
MPAAVQARARAVLNRSAPNPPNTRRSGTRSSRGQSATTAANNSAGGLTHQSEVVLARRHRLLSEHLHYEAMMTFGLARLLVETQGTVLNQLVHNAEIEAFTIHVRQLIDFLWTDREERPKSTDAFASDYFAAGEWAKLRPERPAILSEALHRKVGWGVAH